MVRKKLETKEVEEYSAKVYRSLRRGFHYGIMSKAEYDRWYEKLLVAAAEKDCEYWVPPFKPLTQLWARKSYRCNCSARPPQDPRPHPRSI